jgi:hypothetical protein
MVLHQKRGQFFFVATLIIITVILLLTDTSNFVLDKKTDTRYKSLTEEIKFEGTQIINNGYFNNLSFEEINSSLIEFTKEYSKTYPVYNITIIIGQSEDPSSFQYTTFSQGKPYQGGSLITDGKNFSLSLNSLKLNFNIARGFNFNVIVIEENEKGRFVSTR